MHRDFRWRSTLWTLLLLAPVAAAQAPRPDPYKSADSPILLDLPMSGTDADAIDYAKLPVIKGKITIVNPKDPAWKFQLHNYLIHHEGRFLCMWSHGPSEDTPPQHIRFATSRDGLKWSESKVLVGPPKDGYAYIARGFWLRDGELLALVAHFKGQGAFGVDKELKLEAYAWNKADDSWRFKGMVFENAINSYPPQKLASGEWMMTRRDARFNVYMIVGGSKALDEWRVNPVVKLLNNPGNFRPDEPIWWPLENGALSAVFRDNGGSTRLYRSFSTDRGATWSTPVKTNFPNAPSKVFSMRTSTGQRILVGNSNPKAGRRQMFLAVSPDGLVFPRMFLLDIPTTAKATVQYPHVIEYEGKLLIAYSANKTWIELMTIDLADIGPARQEDR